MFYVFTLCHFVLVIFSPFSIAITSLGEDSANLRAFRTFVRFVLVWICRFPLPLGVWERLRSVIVALPGLFSYLFSIVIYIYYIYIITCTKCGKQYVGETGDHVNQRMNGHRNDWKHKRVEKSPNAEHFCSPEHDFLNHAVLCCLDHNPEWTDRTRKARERERATGSDI